MLVGCPGLSFCPTAIGLSRPAKLSGEGGMMAAPFLDRRPSREDPHPVIEGRDLARLIGVPYGELQHLAARMQLPFSFSPSVGIWIRRRDLPQWQRAAKIYTGGDETGP